jgi:hypothetical protein
MDFIGILFILIGICIIAGVIIFYPYVEEIMMNYLIKESSYQNITEIKDTMKTLDEKTDGSPIETTNEIFPEKKSFIDEVVQIPYDFLKRMFIYYGKPVLHNSIDPFL